MYIDNDYVTENTKQLERNANQRTAMIDFSLNTTNPKLDSLEIVKVQYKNLLESIQHDSIFDQLIGFSFGELKSGCMRFVIRFDGLIFPNNIEFPESSVVIMLYMSSDPPYVFAHSAFPAVSNSARKPL